MMSWEVVPTLVLVSKKVARWTNTVVLRKVAPHWGVLREVSLYGGLEVDSALLQGAEALCATAGAVGLLPSVSACAVGYVLHVCSDGLPVLQEPTPMIRAGLLLCFPEVATVCPFLVGGVVHLLGVNGGGLEGGGAVLEGPEGGGVLLQGAEALCDTVGAV